MSDIAMLVAEEYERRVRKGASAGDIDMLSCVSLMASKLKEKNKQLLHQLFLPKTQLSVAASNCFFSA
ncbi:hypothetical protein VNO78_10677 [Psophocarpus tetragonolobus]|uniref:Uncharacterized protein n=1 Tax=Psophocarpus tetragonolobus TaxID=3891 RepID=A0AAN9SRT7_PSOTE